MAGEDGTSMPSAGGWPNRTAPSRGPKVVTVVALTLAAAVVGLVLFVAGVLVGVAIGTDRSTATGGAVVPRAGSEPGPPTVTANGILDHCLVGRWRSVEHRESADTERGRVTITGVQRTITVSADGTERVTYGDAPATVTTDQGRGAVTYRGTVVYRLSSSAGRLGFTLVSADATMTVAVSGSDPQTQEVKPGTGAVVYTCSSSRLVQEASGFRAVYERESR